MKNPKYFGEKVRLSVPPSSQRVIIAFRGVYTALAVSCIFEFASVASISI